MSKKNANFALNLDPKTGRILSATYPKYASPSMVLVEALPEGDISEYIYKDGEYIHEPVVEDKGEDK